MNKNKLAHLLRLQAGADRLRGELGVSAPGEVIYRRARNEWSPDEVIVEADGFGGSRVRVIDGNFPIDFTVRHEEAFGTEEAGIRAAEVIAEPEGVPSTV